MLKEKKSKSLSSSNLKQVFPLKFFFFFKHVTSLVVVCSISIVINTIYYCRTIKRFLVLWSLGVKDFSVALYLWKPPWPQKAKKSCACSETWRQLKGNRERERRSASGLKELFFLHGLFPWFSSFNPHLSRIIKSWKCLFHNIAHVYNMYIEIYVVLAAPFFVCCVFVDSVLAREVL